MSAVRLALTLTALVVASCSAALPADETPQRSAAPLSVLALGDSYTAGTLVDEADTWPARLAAILDSQGRAVTVEVVAEQGWSSRRLALELEQRPPGGVFDVVVLATGVNDHFNRFGKESFARGLDALAGIVPSFVADDGTLLVVSVPDWSASPWAESRGRVADGLASFNELLAERASVLGARFVDVNDIVRDAADDAYASDGLHPGPEIYAEWASRVAEALPSDG